MFYSLYADQSEKQYMYVFSLTTMSPRQLLCTVQYIKNAEEYD